MKGENSVGVYFRNSAMMAGGPFRCYNCNRLLMVKLTGDQYKVELKCPRCKAYIIIKMRESVPWAKKEEKPEELTQQGT